MNSPQIKINKKYCSQTPKQQTKLVVTGLQQRGSKQGWQQKKDNAIETVAKFNLDWGNRNCDPVQSCIGVYLGTLQRAFRPLRNKTAPVRLIMPSPQQTLQPQQDTRSKSGYCLTSARKEVVLEEQNQR